MPWIRFHQWCLYMRLTLQDNPSRSTCPSSLAMADIAPQEPGLTYNEEKLRTPSEKVSFDSDEKKGIDDATVVKDIEAFEERLQNDEADDEEYLIHDAADVALKASMQPGSERGVPLTTRLYPIL